MFALNSSMQWCDIQWCCALYRLTLEIKTHRIQFVCHSCQISACCTFSIKVIRLRSIGVKFFWLKIEFNYLCWRKFGKSKRCHEEVQLVLTVILQSSRQKAAYTKSVSCTKFMLLFRWTNSRRSLFWLCLSTVTKEFFVCKWF